MTPTTPDPLFTSRVVREGTDLTLLAYGPMVKTCMQSAEAAAGEGKSVEVIDLRTLSPLDMGPVHASVRKTGRAVVAHEAHVNLGMGSEIAARDQRGVLLLARGAGASAWAVSTRPTRRAGSRRSTSPTSTGCSTPSTARSPTDAGDLRECL